MSNRGPLSFSYDDAGSMVDKEALPNLCARVNFDTSGNKPGKLGDEPGQKGNVGVVEGMGDTVVDDCPQALVEERFKDITASGIFLKNDINGIGPAGFTAGRLSRRRYVDTRW